MLQNLCVANHTIEICVDYSCLRICNIVHLLHFQHFYSHPFSKVTAM